MSTRDLSNIALFKSDLIEHIATKECPEDLNNAIIFAIDDAFKIWLFEKGYSSKDIAA